MKMNMPAAAKTARQDLVRHIQRFLTTLERVKRPPNRREAYYVLVALEYLEAGDYEQGEQAMRNGEQLVPLPPTVAILRGIHESMTTQQLRDRLAGISDRPVSA